MFHFDGRIPDSGRMTTYTTHPGLRRLADERAIEGSIVHPDDPAWDAARQAWNLAVDQRPAMVAFPESVADAQALVRIAARTDHRIVTQGTGHGATAYQDLSNTILVRTTRMQRSSITGTVCRVGAGVLWGDVAVAAGERGLAALAGSSPDVGVVGYTLGGGIGWLSRRYGLASNRVRSVELVDGEGRAVRTDADHDPELFWAVRGGGGGMGVITSIEFELLPVSEVFAGTMAWSASHAGEVLGAWSRWTREADDRVTSIVKFLNLPDLPFVPEVFRGRRMLTLGAAGVEDLELARRLIDELRRVAPPELDTFDVTPAAGLVRLHGDPEGPTAGMSHHTLLSDFDDATARRLDDAVGTHSATSLVAVEVRHLGGALARPADGGGALSHIEAPYVLNAVGVAGDPTSAERTWTELSDVVDAMRPWHAGAYLNFAERNEGSVFDSGTIRRIADVKRRVDPNHRFAVRSGLPIAAEE